jgi:hypothetical protein
VGRQFESLRQQPAQHQPRLVRGCSRRLGLDIEAVAIEPGRAANKLKGLEVVRVQDQHAQ